jgi:hypothetical protein
MNPDDKLAAALGLARGAPRRAVTKFRPTPIDPETTPAPRTQELIQAQGRELTKRAVEAWGARLAGEPIIDIAAHMGVSIEAAKALIRDAYTALREDLKDTLDQNRQLDLGRIDGLIQTYYPSAREGDIDCANVIMKCLQHRAKLTGIEPAPDPGRTSQPANILVWIQQQLPSINKIVDALPPE